MTPDSDPRLPRSPQDEGNLRRLREEAARRLLAEEKLQAEMETSRESAAPVYGMPPPERPSAATVYGGPPAGLVTRRWTLRGILLLALGVIGGILAAIFGWRRWSAPVYGGPPAPVYGGPVPQPTPISPDNPTSPVKPRIKPAPKPKPSSKQPLEPELKPQDVPRPPAPVYGGPPPHPRPAPPPPPPPSQP